MASSEIFQFNDDLLFCIETPMNFDLTDTTDNRVVEFVCPKHRIRLTDTYAGLKNAIGYKLVCPVCEKDDECKPIVSSDSLESLKKKALALHDKDIFREAKLVRLDDYYVPEIKKFDALPNNTDYSIKADVKTDKDGDTIVVLYVGHKGDREKAQLFIKPEKLQLSSDHKDLDPAKILSKIELTLKDRTITQEYEDKT